MPSKHQPHLWVPFGSAVRRIREAKGISVETFCKKARCSEETLERLERRHTKMLPYRRLHEYATDILGCDVREIGCPLDDIDKVDSALLPRAFAAERTKEAAPVRAAEPIPSLAATASVEPRDTPFRSNLDKLRIAEKKLGLAHPPSARWQDAMYPQMTATAMWHIHSACAVHENELFSATGTLPNQRRLNRPEQIVLQCGYEGSRFELLKPIGNHPVPLSLTLFTNTGEHTKFLQLFLDREDVRVSVLVRVIVAAPDPEYGGKLSVTNPRGGKRILCPDDWKNFFVFNTTKTTPWGLLVERVSDPID